MTDTTIDVGRYIHSTGMLIDVLSVPYWRDEPITVEDPPEKRWRYATRHQSHNVGALPIPGVLNKLEVGEGKVVLHVGGDVALHIPYPHTPYGTVRVSYDGYRRVLSWTVTRRRPIF